MVSLLLSASVSAEVFSTEEWWGSVGLGYQRYVDDLGRDDITQQISADINGRYHIWQPWFINGRMRLLTATEQRDESGIDRSRSTLGGELDMAVLPLSKFPLKMGYKKNTYTIATTDQSYIAGPERSLTNTSYYLIQSYLADRYKLMLSYHMDENENELTGKSNSELTRVEMSRRDPGSDLNVSMQQLTTEHDASDGGTDAKTAVVAHNYRPTNAVTVATNASKVDQLDMIDLDGDGISDRYTTGIDQVSSTVLWRSDSGATRVNGSLRYYDLNTERLGIAEESESASMGGGVQHTLNKNVNLSATANYIKSNDSGLTSTVSQYTGIAQYHSDTIMLAEYSYNWGASLVAAREYSGDSSSTTSGAGLNHVLNRSWLYGRSGTVQLSLDQAVGYQAADVVNQTADGTDQTANLVQGAHLGYTNRDNSGTMYAQARFNDSRNLTGSEKISQILNLQLSRQQRLSMRSSLNGSLTYQQNKYQGDLQSIDSRAISATVNYSSRLDFSFQSLTFDSSISYANYSSNVIETNESYRWNNTLKHQIGQLFSSLTASIYKVDNLNSAMIMANVSRRF